MVGSQEFAQRVEGEQGGPIATNTTGTIETDNYGEGGGFDYDGSAYPYTLDPPERLEELSITTAGDIDAEITTTTGTTFTVPLAGGVGIWDKWSIDKVVFRDPKGTTARLGGGWAGE